MLLKFPKNFGIYKKAKFFIHHKLRIKLNQIKLHIYRSFSKNEMLKSKEFFNKIIELKNSNPQIKLEAQKRLQRDFSA